MYEDKTLICRDCGAEFTFTAGEQEFYAEKGFQNEPVRCKACRDARKNARANGGNANAERAPRQMHEITCAACGRVDRVSFLPRDDRPVYCKACFQAMRESAR
ncbi:MAG: zinc-ribbon domain containing protein [Clostridia bacterium]|nr:zinc-ribbon domain containing protein [Clostridia bacterium]